MILSVIALPSKKIKFIVCIVYTHWVVTIFSVGQSHWRRKQKEKIKQQEFPLFRTNTIHMMWWFWMSSYYVFMSKTISLHCIAYTIVIYEL